MIEITEKLQELLAAAKALPMVEPGTDASAEITYEEVDGTAVTFSIAGDADFDRAITLEITLTGTPKEIVSIGGYFIGVDTDIPKAMQISLVYPWFFDGIVPLAMWSQGADSPYNLHCLPGRLSVSGNTVQLVIDTAGIEPSPKRKNAQYTTANLYIGYTT